MKRVIPGLMFVHRYLGVAFCLIFVIWFASGIVMVYKRMPEYSAEERLARLPPLNAAAIRFTPAEAMEAASVQQPARRVLLTSLQSRPVYRFTVDGGTATVFADAGSYLYGLEPEDAVAVAVGAFPEARGTARHLAALERPDQWTINNRFRVTGALHHVTLGDSAGTEVYVAETTGDIVMKTDRSSRLWGYAGPVMHFFYFHTASGRARCAVGQPHHLRVGRRVSVVRTGPGHRRVSLLSGTPLQARHVGHAVRRVDAVASLCRAAGRRVHVHLGLQRATDNDPVELIRPERTVAGADARDPRR